MDIKLTTAENTAKSLMLEHKLQDWTFEWSNTKSRFGYCDYCRKIISLSKVITPLREDKAVRNTILHEIAHALNYITYKATGHNRSWRMIFLSIGGSGEKNSSDVFDRAKISKYIGYCPNGHAHYRQRASKREESCGLCSRTFNRAYLIEYKINTV